MKSDKKLLKSEKKRKRQENRGTIGVYAQLTCGCCDVEMRFKNIEAAEKAFRDDGLGNKKTIIDDKGVIHEGVDTFYGFSTERF